MSSNKESKSNSISVVELADAVAQGNNHINEAAKLISTVIAKVLADFPNANSVDDRFDAISTLMDAIYKIKVDFFPDEDIQILKKAWHQLDNSNTKSREAIRELDQLGV